MLDSTRSPAWPSCDDPEEWNERRTQEGGNMYIYLWLISIVVQQKPTQHCKAIICQLKILKNSKDSLLKCKYKKHILSFHMCVLTSGV